MKIIRGTFIYSLSGIVVSFLSFVQIKIITGALPKGDVGLFFGLTGTVMFIADFLKLGLPKILPRFIPLYDSRDEPRKAKELLGFGVFVYFVLMLTSIVIAMLIAKFLGVRSTFWQLIPLAFLSYSPMAILSVLTLGLIAMRKPLVASIFVAIPPLVYTILIFLTRNTLTLPLLFLLIFVSYLPFVIFSLFVARPGKPFVFKWDKEFLEFTKYAVLSTIFAPVYHHYDYVILSSLSAFPSLALFGVARKVENFLRRLLWLPLEALAPEISFRDKNPLESREFINILTKLYLIFGILITVPIILYRKEIILLISQSEYAGAGVFLFLLSIHVVLLTIMSPYSVAARSLGHMNIAFIKDIVRNGSYMIIALVFTKLWGPTGMALSFIFSTIFGLMYIIPACIRIGINPPELDYLVKVFALAIGSLLIGMHLNRPIGIFILLSIIFVFWQNLPGRQKTFLLERISRRRR